MGITRQKELEKMEMENEKTRIQEKLNKMNGEGQTSVSCCESNDVDGNDNDLQNAKGNSEGKNLTIKKLTNKCEILQNMISVMHLKVKDSLLSMELAERAVSDEEDVGKETVQWIEREIAALKKDKNFITDDDTELASVNKHDIGNTEPFGDKPTIVTGIALCLTLASIIKQWQ